MQRLRTMHLFAGAGGGLLADILLGHQPVCAVELDWYCQQVLSARQKDGNFPWFPIFGDVQQFDGKPWRGIVDVVAGGFPCQDISVAGKGAGLDGERSGLWSEFARVIGEVRPKIAFIENSPALLTRGLDRVLCDLTALGYDAKWGVVSAADVGAPHKRERLWIYATDPIQQRCDDGSSDWQKRPFLYNEHGDAPKSERKRLGRLSGACPTSADVANPTQLQCNGGDDNQKNSGASKQQPRGSNCTDNVANTMCERWKRGKGQQQATGQSRLCSGEGADEIKDFRSAASNWAIEPELGRVVNGLANRAHRLKAIGNGQVPQSAALAWSILQS